MMGAETIRSMTQDAGAKAAQDNMVPFIIWPQNIEDWKAGRNLPIPFPFIGDHEPAGYKPVGDPLFIDTSGFGYDSEPALSMSQLLDKLEVDKAYALIEVGQFQAYLQAYDKV